MFSLLTHTCVNRPKWVKFDIVIVILPFIRRFQQPKWNDRHRYLSKHHVPYLMSLSSHRHCSKTLTYTTAGGPLVSLRVGCPGTPAKCGIDWRFVLAGRDNIIGLHFCRCWNKNTMEMLAWIICSWRFRNFFSKVFASTNSDHSFRLPSYRCLSAGLQ